MKKTKFVYGIIILIMLFNINISKGQYLNDNALWFSSSFSFGGQTGPFHYTTICGDTLIDNQNYKKVSLFSDSTTPDSIPIIVICS